MADGFQNLRAQLLGYIADELDDLPELAVGDSPIERLLFCSLLAATRFGVSEHRHVVVPSDRYPLAALLDRADQLALIVVPQVQLQDWRVDFVVYAWEFGRVSGREQWRRAIVECDGHAFHERTKQQAKRDRSRDREWQQRGYTVLRFTGSEIHNDPMGCARSICEWAVMGW